MKKIKAPKLSEEERKRIWDAQVEESKQRMRQQRAEHFEVLVKPSIDVWLYEREIIVSVTKDGRHYDVQSFTLEELEKVNAAIALYLMAHGGEK